MKRVWDSDGLVVDSLRFEAGMMPKVRKALRAVFFKFSWVLRTKDGFLRLSQTFYSLVCKFPRFVLGMFWVAPFRSIIYFEEDSMDTNRKLDDFTSDGWQSDSHCPTAHVPHFTEFKSLFAEDHSWSNTFWDPQPISRFLHGVHHKHLVTW